MDNNSPPSPKKKVERDGSETGSNLDEEMEKVFESGARDKFDVASLSGIPQSAPSPRFDEQDYSFHRKKSYPHTHAPLKALPRAMRKRSSSSVKEGGSSEHLEDRLSRQNSQTGSVGRQSSVGPSVSQQSPTMSRQSSVVDPTMSRQSSQGIELSRQSSFTATDSDTGQINTTASIPMSSPEPEEGSTNDDYSQSECEAPTSERASTFGANLNTSPDRKVQFDVGTPELGNVQGGEHGETGDAQSQDEKREEKRRRRHSKHHHHHRKYSMPEDPGWRKRSGAEALPRQMSAAILEETSNLQEADQDELVSHRFDVSKGKRRFSVKTKEMGSGKKESSTVVTQGVKKAFDHSPHEVFVQLDELSGFGEEREWKETARWIKYEEDVEEGAERWGRPHVAPLSFHSLLNLRRCLETGVILLDLEEKELPGVVYRVVEQMAVEELISLEDKSIVMRALLLRHRHVQDHDRFRFNVRRNTASYTSLQNLSDDNKKVKIVPSATNLDVGKSNLLQPPGAVYNHTTVDMKEETYTSSTEDLAKKAAKESILKRIPLGAEATTVLVGSVDFLSQPTIAFVRLAEGIHIPSVTEVPIPVRFMFILLGPLDADLDYHEIGRSISTLMSNPEFHKIAYRAAARKELLSAINEFLNCSIVLPPGDWERQALLPFKELKAKTEAIRRRHSRSIDDDPDQKKALIAGDDGKKPPYPDPLQRVKKPWGGLINDIKRRYPKFRSDVMEGLNGQSLAATIFMYFAALSGAITFGGLMADKTDNLVGISETLLSTALAGIVFALMSGQPLVIIGVTGPLLLFEESLYQFCSENEIDYLTMRVYIGAWLAVIALVVSFFEGSVFVKLFTRFTEEIFASLISLLFIVESVMQLISVFQKHPLMTLTEYCNETEVDGSMPLSLGNSNSSSRINKRELSRIFNETLTMDFNETLNANHTIMFIPVSPSPMNQPNTALLSLILTLGTFFIAYYLRHFRNSKFLGRSARRMLGDFGVPIAIVIMVLLDYLVPGTYTEKLKVPEGLSPSKPEVRGWVIPPSGLLQPIQVWVMFLSIVPAMLIYILLFMETHICELIIDKKERNLKKGSGFHLDIVLICLLNVGCGIMGAPFMCAATVRSVTHVAAVTVMSRTHAPGEKPHIIEVKEQRVSGLLVSVLVGVSVAMSPLLRLVPMAVLFGVFLYMGVSAISGIQFFDRLRLFFMPVKHHPQVAYVRRVQTLKMHLFTFIQVLALALLWIVKSSEISLAFPFFLILMIPLRAQFRFLFSPLELRALDSDEPETVDEEEDPDFYEEAVLPG